MPDIEAPDRFRVLIIGRANAGKTTILRAVYGAEEEPEEEPTVYDRKGFNKIKSLRLTLRTVRNKITGHASPTSATNIPSPSHTRGLHDIEAPLVFPSNPRLVFHDSRGFESGSDEELELVRNFIQSRADKIAPMEQLHVIWYCFPTDSNRIITAAEQEFFKTIDTGSVPVIAIFSKFDALDASAFVELEASGVPFEQAQIDAPEYAEKQFNLTHLPLIMDQPHPPRDVVYLRNFHDKKFCHDIRKGASELVEKTLASISNDDVKRLLVLSQRANVETCIKAAVESGVITTTAQKLRDAASFDPDKKFIVDLFKWFPYVWDVTYEWEKGQGRMLDFGGAAYAFKGPLSCRLPLLVGTLSPPLQVFAVGLAAIIVAANAFWLQPGNVYQSNIREALEQYIKSGASSRVQEAIFSSFAEHDGTFNTSACKDKLVQIVLNNHNSMSKLMC
ncbi:hypothetical protein BOTBODRAFT_32630 [Botryobasidium botryosum FD-172 SS1]|uniref:G domain-containing protein n=1 Tax=Botryobasidium botryosum (strain FD-172 SS1) TaxID=930990 RepID=A0A067MIF2_BOTB1|nr:hypothetical protein BOTBODRAFT_32630 [Botryobasidium botryosum FD-172 SS1]